MLISNIRREVKAEEIRETFRKLGNLPKSGQATKIWEKRQTLEKFSSIQCSKSGWLGRAMVLGSFQCRGVLILWHMVGQGLAMLAAGAGRMGCYLFIISSRPSYLPFSNALSVGRRLDILKYCGLDRYNPAVVVSYYRRHAC